MAMEFRPYVMAVHQPRFRSRSVNTDDLGFREQIGPDRSRWQLTDLQKRFDSCSVILGGSTAFGVDATSDDSSIPARLTLKSAQRGRHLYVNLGLRGATSAQEAHVFLFAIRFLPRIENVVVLSGVNDAYMSVVDAGQRWSPFGALVSDRFYYLRFREQYNQQSTNREVRYHAAVENWLMSEFAKQSRFRKIVFRAYHYYAANQLVETGSSPASDIERHKAAIADIISTLSSVRVLAAGAKLTYVLQPAAQWCRKPLTALERAILAEDSRLEPANAVYATPDFYSRFSADVAAACAAAGIDFRDANDWLDDPAYAAIEIFTDLCHLTDEGNRVVADRLWALCSEMR